MDVKSINNSRVLELNRDINYKVNSEHFFLNKHFFEMLLTLQGCIGCIPQEELFAIRWFEHWFVNVSSVPTDGSILHLVSLAQTSMVTTWVASYDIYYTDTYEQPLHLVVREVNTGLKETA